ncbi:mitochondrial ribonuclease P protein 1 homolog [Epargyreus clarus]|uniref:mitochondrial ribonuclease P protein 1 homolog n=1 Tax=Epargyreus clarus TaxID=520877 RepID=UPI003C2ABC8C
MHCIRSFLAHVRHFPKNRAATRCAKITATNKIVTQNRFYNTSIDEDETEKIVQELSKGNAELEKKLRVLMLEVEVMRQDGRPAPNTLKKDQWEQLLELPSRNQRNHYLLFLFKTEKAKENRKAKKETKRQEYENSEPEDTREYPDDLLYGLKHQSLFLRIRDQSINNFDNYRSLQSMRYGQPLIIDCSYEEHMVRREIVNAAVQVTLLFGDNRIHKDPFDVHLCNVNLEGPFMRQVHKNIPLIDEPWCPLNIHSKSYLDMFPKDKLVYLTPHCREEITNYDHDAVYIIGCMVDKINNEPLSLAKAKRDGLKMGKLPLDRYLEWGPGSKKNLNVNHMISILLDLKATGDWEYALRHVPRRKLMSTKIAAMEKKLKNPYLKDEITKNYKKYRNILPNIMKEKRYKQRSLYDDDNI